MRAPEAIVPDAARATATPVVRSLRMIDALDFQIGAWAAIDYKATAAAHDGPLAGLPVGVKDMLDVAGLPTSAGSRSRIHAKPAPADAEVVKRLRQAGAVPIGKTVTTEFAFIDPAATRNPYALTHSPGGSSSGSAAAVAAGMVPMALGTQTAGSLCRPAAYCGIAAIKPSYGLLPVAGLTPLSPSFDTIGVMARTVRQANEALAVMAGGHAGLGRHLRPSGRIAILPRRFYATSSPDVAHFHDDVTMALRKLGFVVDTVDPGVDFAEIVMDHRVVMLFEAHALHGHLLTRCADRLRPLFRDALRIGKGISHGELGAAQARIEAARRQVWRALAGHDAIVLQPAPAAAPEGFRNTGDQSYQTPWTAFHGPLVTVPGRFNAQGLPLATMVGAAPGRDTTAIAIADILQGIVDSLPPAATIRARAGRSDRTG